MSTIRMACAALLVAAAASAQTLAPNTTNDPFSQPIAAGAPAITVGFVEFASLPDVGNQAARPMQMVVEPGTRRMFVNDMRGPLYRVSEDGKSVTLYLDTNAPTWGMPVQSQGRERGVQSFALHPQFNQRGTAGFGKLYTYTDTTNVTPTPDFLPTGEYKPTHDTVLLEWTAKNPGAATYDGAAPRELMRLRQPFANHNGGDLRFNPLTRPGQPEFGLLYVGVADGGSGGDPLNLAQNLANGFGKIFRIDPLGKNSPNGKYGIPASNPFVGDNDPNTLGEIYAYGVRNPQRFAWDPRNGNLFLADIGQNIDEEVSLVTRGANLGWNTWEGSYGYISREAVSLTNQRGDPKVTYPVVEYGQPDPLLQATSAVTGVVVYRGKTIPQLANLVLFGDNPSGELFYFSADKLPNGGQDAIRRILFNHNGANRTLLELIREKNQAQGKKPADRADLRFGTGPGDQIFILNKQDGTIRMLK